MDNKTVEISEYESLRQKIVEENQNLVGVVLNDDEKKVDAYLTKLKEKFKTACNNDIPYNMPVLLDERIINSELYSFCMKLPKGSDLHVHGTSLVPVHYLLDFVYNHEKILINLDNYLLTYQKDDNCYSLKYAIDNNLIKKESIIKKWTVLGKKEDENIWNYFEQLFSYTEAIDLDYDILKDYYVFAFNYYLDVNISHVEIHVLLSKNINETRKTVQTIKDAYFEVKRKREELVVSIIGTSMKMFDSMQDSEDIINCVLKVREEIKDDFDPNDIHYFVLGVDLINEEDKSRPLKEYAPLLIEIKKNNPEFEYYLHCGESINANNDNLIDAFLLRAERVGHGTNLYRYPSLLKEYVKNEICLESCLISNQILDYVKDLRLHPSAEYLKRGVTISLCSDDPIFFENEALVDDFFAAIVCWDIGLAEIKHLCINSIMYSGLDRNSKILLMKKWHEQYKVFINYYLKLA